MVYICLIADYLFSSSKKIIATRRNRRGTPVGKRERGGSAPKKKTLNLAWNFVKRSADSHDDCLSLSSVPTCFRRVASRVYRDCKREKPRCMIMNIWMNNGSEIGGMIKGYYRWQCHPQRNAFLTNLKRERARKHIPYASSSRCYAPTQRQTSTSPYTSCAINLLSVPQS